MQGQRKTVRNAVMTLRAMWKSAKAWGYSHHDPFDGLRLPFLKKKEQPFFTAEQMQHLSSTPSDPTKHSIGWPPKLACVPVSCAGLQWPDVKQGLRRCREKRLAGCEAILKTPTGVRSFAISTELQARLESMREGNGYVFPSEKGSRGLQNDIQKRHLVPLLKRLACRRLLPAFRHGNETSWTEDCHSQRQLPCG